MSCCRQIKNQSQFKTHFSPVKNIPIISYQEADMMKLSLLIFTQIFTTTLIAQTHMAIFNKCRAGGDDSACRYVQLSKEKADAKEKCGLVFKNNKACEAVKSLEIELGKILSESPDLKTAEADVGDEKIQMAKPDKKFRKPASEEAVDDGDCDNCG